MDQIEKIILELTDLHNITKDEEALQEEGENYVFGRIEELTTELYELVGEEKTQEILNKINS